MANSVVVLMAPQGAGKGTQAHLLSETLGLPVIATGDILRKIAEEDSDLGRTVKTAQAAGQLVPDSVLDDVINDRIRRGDCDSGCIFDGFPRTLPQAEFLDELAKQKHLSITVVNISVPRETLLKRLAGRRMCPACGTLYNVYFKPPKREGYCDLDGKDLVTREDDNEESIERRLNLFREKTRPLLEYYRSSERLRQIDGLGEADEVYRRILDSIQPPA
ncbi:MAG TPA: adenylate kinase [Blastocatellia bacterium]|nr:adenylate kinase [Blastocatellia bacterium]